MTATPSTEDPSHPPPISLSPPFPSLPTSFSVLPRHWPTKFIGNLYLRSVNYTRRQVLDFSSPRGARPIFHVHAFPLSPARNEIFPPPFQLPSFSSSSRRPSTLDRRACEFDSNLEKKISFGKTKSKETRLHRLNSPHLFSRYDKFVFIVREPGFNSRIVSIEIRRYDIYDVANGHPLPVSFHHARTFPPPPPLLVHSRFCLLSLEFPFDHPRLHLFPRASPLFFPDIPSVEEVHANPLPRLADSPFLSFVFSIDSFLFFSSLSRKKLP